MVHWGNRGETSRSQQNNSDTRDGILQRTVHENRRGRGDQRGTDAENVLREEKQSLFSRIQLYRADGPAQTAQREVKWKAQAREYLDAKEKNNRGGSQKKSSADNNKVIEKFEKKLQRNPDLERILQEEMSNRTLKEYNQVIQYMNNLEHKDHVIASEPMSNRWYEYPQYQDLRHQIEKFEKLIKKRPDLSDMVVKEQEQRKAEDSVQAISYVDAVEREYYARKTGGDVTEEDKFNIETIRLKMGERLNMRPVANEEQEYRDKEVNFYMYAIEHRDSHLQWVEEFEQNMSQKPYLQLRVQEKKEERIQEQVQKYVEALNYRDLMQETAEGRNEWKHDSYNDYYKEWIDSFERGAGRPEVLARVHEERTRSEPERLQGAENRRMQRYADAFDHRDLVLQERGTGVWDKGLDYAQSRQLIKDFAAEAEENPEVMHIVYGRRRNVNDQLRSERGPVNLSHIEPVPSYTPPQSNDRLSPPSYEPSSYRNE